MPATGSLIHTLQTVVCVCVFHASRLRVPTLTVNALAPQRVRLTTLPTPTRYGRLVSPVGPDHTYRLLAADPRGSVKD